MALGKEIHKMEIKNVFVVGAGLMGFGIAQVAAQSGFEVKVFDVVPAQLEKGLKGTATSFDKRISKGKMTTEEKDEILKRITLCNSLEDAKNADLVIEAVAEKEDVKMDVFKKLSDIVREDTILATNTSSLSISSIASVVKNPGRFVGMHFFSPVPVMKLLEIVVGFLTTDETIEIVKSVGERFGKVMIVAKDEPGFIVNRMIDPMGNEAVKLLERGVGSIEDIDKGCRFGLNHPIGPLELMDAAGIDIEYAAMSTMFAETGDPAYRPAVLMRTMVKSGYIGKKAGKGFYIYHEDGTKTPNPAIKSMLK